MDPPSARSLRAAATLNKRLERRAKVRFSFVRRAHDGKGEVPPLARMLRGGQGGEVRLKLFLTLLWVAGGGDPTRHMTHAYPARMWAALLDLPQPEGRGQRRVRDAMQWLEREGFVQPSRKPGMAKAIKLLLEDGSGRDYFNPAEYAHKLKESETPLEDADLYVSLPATFWTDGWIMILSARAIALLLILAADTFGAKGWRPVTPSVARSRYVISEDTWSKGVAELRDHGLIAVRKEQLGWRDFDDFVESDFKDVRVRNTYLVPRSGYHVKLPDPPFDVKAIRGAESPGARNA